MKTEQGSENGQRPAMTPLAIVGIGSLFPQAGDTGVFWSNIREGVDAITEVPETHWRSDDYFDPNPKTPDKVYAKGGGFLAPVDFRPMDYGVLPNALEAIDTSQLLGLVAVEQALRDAGYAEDNSLDRDRVSVVLGVTGTLELVVPLGARLGHPRWRDALRDAGIADAIAEDVMQRISDSYVPWQENSFPGLLGNVVAGRISKHFDFGGTNCVVDAACGSSLSALNLAALELTTGRADMVISGGIDTFNDIFMYTCFSKTPALSPSGHARPFDADGDGTTLGEGLGIVVLKRLSDAERDGDRIYAVIKGLGTSSDGRGAAIYEPSAAGQQKALRRAYQQAGISPHSIELIEAHGTGTKVGDAVEVNALKEIFGKAEQPWCAIGSIKSQIGHTKAAAGAAGLIKAALALYHKTLPPTIKVSKPQKAVTEEGSPFYVNSEARPWLANPDHPRRAGVSALGFGGSNFHCLLEEHRPQKLVADWTGNEQIIALSADRIDQLETALKEFPLGKSWDELRLAADRSRRDFDGHKPYRLLMVVNRHSSNLDKQCQTALSLLHSRQDQTSWSTPDGIYFGQSSKRGELAILFPGQGAQYPGMLRDLAIQFPEFFDSFAKADRAFAENAPTAKERLVDLVYPRPVFDDQSRKRNEAQLRATQVAQPALGAVSLAALTVVESFGLEAAAFAGHSYGELAALCAAGCYETGTLHALSRLRGELMAAGDGDRGSMLAVAAPLAQIEAFLAESGLELTLANRNTPEQGVLSGTSSAIDQAAGLLERKGIRQTRLEVAAAFHSSLVAEAATPFAQRLQEVDFEPLRQTVYANTTGDRYPQAAAEIRELLAGQLAQPVDFVNEIEAMYAAGIRTFLEVGPGARLTGMVKAILGERPHQAIALDASAGKRSGIEDLGRALAQLAAAGHPVKLVGWDAEFADLQSRQPAKKPGLTVKLSGANHFNPPPKRPPLSQEQGISAAAPRPAAAMATVSGPETTAAPAPPQALSSNFNEALQTTRQSLAALQNLQEQTARLHQQFLAGQEATTRTFMSLVEQQNRLLRGEPLAPAAVQPAEAPERPAQTSIAVPVAPAAKEQGTSLATAQMAQERHPSAGQQTNQIATTLLAVVAEKTGYPEEMLEPEMSLDADLGIDSIKRVEILSALQERLPEAPPVKPEDLGVLQTLAQIIAHLGGDSAASPQAGKAPRAAGVDQNRVRETLLAVIAEKTGYPVEMLEPEMTLDTDLGIDSIKRVEILSALQEKLPEAPPVKPEDLGVLQTIGQIVEHLGQATQAVQPVETSELDQGRVRETLLSVIAEKTGYPIEMLDPEMTLDSDLGIDSIKRVEILSALQERLPEAPPVKPEDLGVLQTIGQIVEHLGRSSSPPPPSASQPAAGSVLDHKRVAAVLIGVIAEKTGYPEEMLELGMALDSDLGIDSIKRVEILSALQQQLPGAPPIKPEHLGTLQTVGQIVDFLASVSGAAQSDTGSAEDFEPPVVGQGVDRQLLRSVPLPTDEERVSLNLPRDAVVWVTDDGTPLTESLCASLAASNLLAEKVDPEQWQSLALPANLAGLLLVSPSSGANDAFLENSFLLMQRAAPSLTGAGAKGGALFATISRLNGHFGLTAGGAIEDPLSGGLAGLAKTAGHEWPEVSCRAVDLATGLDPGAAAKTLVAELLSGGPQEVGLTDQGLMTLELVEQPLITTEESSPVGYGDLVVISGGARGVTAEVAVALAAASRATLLLLGRSPLPAAEPDWAQGLATEAELKKGILAQSGSSLKPIEVQRQCQTLLANREIRRTLQRIKEAGGQPLYRSVDLRDRQSLAAVLDEIRDEYGPCRGLIHGAGVLADRLIKDKSIEQFKQVYATKVEGLRNLLAALGDDTLRFLVTFSSSTGRFGRTGQVDYAAANEILNKLAQQQATLRQDCRVLSLNWGPWDGGMVTPSLKKIFAEEGVSIIDLKAGADYLVKEIASPPGGPVELVILGGRDQADFEGLSQPHENIYVSEAFDLELSIEQYPFLKSHVIDGKAVLPMAVMIEWMAHGAIHNNPGLRFHGLNDLRVLKGVTLTDGQSHSLQVMTGKAFKSDGLHVVPVELSGENSAGQKFVHARARIVLTNKLPDSRQPMSGPELGTYHRSPAQTYQTDRLFHGPDFQGIREVIGCSKEGIAALVRPAPLPTDWIRQPLRSAWLADPLALDVSFQLMILWSFEQYQAGSLPVFAGRYRQYRDRFPESGVEIRVRVTAQSASKATAEIDFVDPTNDSLIAHLENYECVIDASLNVSFQRNKLQGAA